MTRVGGLNCVESERTTKQTNRFVGCESDGGEVDQLNDDYDNDDGSDEVCDPFHDICDVAETTLRSCGASTSWY